MKTLHDKKFWIIIAIAIVIVGVAVYFATKKPKEESSTVSSVAPATSKTVLPDRNIFPLRMGSRGDEVLAVQKYVNEKLKKQVPNGFVAPLPLLVEDGIWGTKTSDAVKYKLGIDQIDYTYYTKIILGIL